MRGRAETGGRRPPVVSRGRWAGHRPPLGLRVAFLFLLFLLGAAASWGSDARPLLPLWEVRDAAGGGSRLWLLGSVHMRGGDGGLDARIEESLEQAGVLAVELDAEARAAELAVRAAALGVYGEGDTVWEHVPPEAHGRLRGALAVLPAGPGLRPERMRPWLLALSLGVAKLQQCGLSNRTGVEVLLLRRARGMKRIVELESVEAQLQAFAGVDEAGQAALLLDTVEHLDEVCGEAEALVAAWAAGDTGRVESLTVGKFEGKPELRSSYDSILLARNRTLAEAVEGLLAPGEPALAVVGVGHLVGREGIVARLRARGYVVTQLEAAGVRVGPGPAGAPGDPSVSAVEVFRAASFAVEMPGAPSEQRLPIPGTDAEATVYLRQLPGGSAYSVTVVPLPRPPAPEEATALLEAAAQQVLGMVPATAAEKREPDRTDGRPSVEHAVSFDGGSLHFKIVVGETALYQVSAVLLGEAPPLDPARFVGSFRLLP